METQIIKNGLALLDPGEDPDIISRPHALWIGCGDLLRRTIEALEKLRLHHNATLIFADIKSRDNVKQKPLDQANFYNVSKAQQRDRLRKYLTRNPLTHIYIANLPPQHLLTAFKFSELCPRGQIIISKPLDVNLPLIETVAKGRAWPDITAKIYVHDHYRNKGAVDPMYRNFPQLTDIYGELRSFEFYLIEPRTVEEENRLEALNEGVIFDLASHLFALAQLFFLEHPHPALIRPDLTLSKARLRINKVARARYKHCQIENLDAETFAAIDVTLIAEYSRLKNPRRPLTYEIPGLMVVGKGIKPSLSTTAGLKGLRFRQELQTRSVNLMRNEVNPPLTDLQYANDRNLHDKEDGFHRPILTSLSHRRGGVTYNNSIKPLVPFMEAAKNAEYLGEAIRLRSELRFYSPGETLDAVMAKCVGANHLDSRWLSDAGYAEIGFG